MERGLYSSPALRRDRVLDLPPGTVDQMGPSSNRGVPGSHTAGKEPWEIPPEYHEHSAAHFFAGRRLYGDDWRPETVTAGQWANIKKYLAYKVYHGVN